MNYLNDLVFGHQLALEALVPLPQVLDASEVLAEVGAAHQQLLLLYPRLLVVQLTEKLLKPVRLVQLGPSRRRQILRNAVHGYKISDIMVPAAVVTG